MTYIPGGGGGGGVTDHGLLTGLADDDHTQYHNNTRGDARYYTQAQVDSSLAGKANTSHTHAAADITSGTIAAARLGSGTADNTKFLRGDGTWAVAGGNFVQATVDFGAADDFNASVTVPAAWVTGTSKIVCSVAAIATAEHDPEDAAIEGLTAYPANISAGVGFDILVYAPRGTFGRYIVNAAG